MLIFQWKQVNQTFFCFQKLTESLSCIIKVEGSTLAYNLNYSYDLKKKTFLSRNESIFLEDWKTDLLMLKKLIIQTKITR